MKLATVRRILTDHGYCGTCDGGMLLYANKCFFIRVFPQDADFVVIQAGVRTSFDRWANSVNFEATIGASFQVRDFLSDIELLIKVIPNGFFYRAFFEVKL